MSFFWSFARACLLPVCLFLVACGNEPPIDPPPPPERDDFKDPVIDPGLPSGVAGLFSGPAQTGGPCLLAPEPGSLLPRNFTAPRVVFAPPQGHNVFLFEVVVPGEKTP